MAWSTLPSEGQSFTSCSFPLHFWHTLLKHSSATWFVLKQIVPFYFLLRALLSLAAAKKGGQFTPGQFAP